MLASVVSLQELFLRSREWLKVEVAMKVVTAKRLAVQLMVLLLSTGTMDHWIVVDGAVVYRLDASVVHVSVMANDAMVFGNDRSGIMVRRVVRLVFFNFRLIISVLLVDLFIDSILILIIELLLDAIKW